MLALACRQINDVDGCPENRRKQSLPSIDDGDET